MIASYFQIINITGLGNELLDNLNSLIREIDLTVMSVESRQGNNIKDKILLRQDHFYQVIQVLAQLQISPDLTNEDQKTLGELKDSFFAIFHTASLGTDFTNFTNYVLTKQYCNNLGRQKFDIPKEVLEEVRVLGFSWVSISKMFKVSRWTIAQQTDGYNLNRLSRYNNMTNDELVQIIRDYISTHVPTTSEPLMPGYLKSKGYRVQCQRVRSSLNRVDRKNTVLRWGALVSRLTYFVASANSLWHLDRHHALIHWKFVIHGALTASREKLFTVIVVQITRQRLSKIYLLSQLNIMGGLLVFV